LFTLARAHVADQASRNWPAYSWGKRDSNHAVSHSNEI